MVITKEPQNRGLAHEKTNILDKQASLGSARNNQQSQIQPQYPIKRENTPELVPTEMLLPVVAQEIDVTVSSASRSHNLVTLLVQADHRYTLTNRKEMIEKIKNGSQIGQLSKATNQS